MGIHEIDSSEDYREIKAQGDTVVSCSTADFYVGSDVAQCDFTIPEGTGRAVSLLVAWGRKISCDSVEDGVACFAFHDICGSPMSAEDYMALVTLNKLHTIVVIGVPRFNVTLHNEARRFTNLVDCLYEHQCRLQCIAGAPLDELMVDMISMTCLPAGPQVLSDCSAGMTDIRIAELDLADARLPKADSYSGINPPSEERVRSADSYSGIDAANEESVMGVLSAASASLEEGGFAARRCISRLREMGTAAYHAAHRTKWALT